MTVASSLQTFAASLDSLAQLPQEQEYTEIYIQSIQDGYNAQVFELNSMFLHSHILDF